MKVKQEKENKLKQYFKEGSTNRIDLSLIKLERKLNQGGSMRFNESSSYAGIAKGKSGFSKEVVEMKKDWIGIDFSGITYKDLLEAKGDYELGHKYRFVTLLEMTYFDLALDGLTESLYTDYVPTSVLHFFKLIKAYTKYTCMTNNECYEKIADIVIGYTKLKLDPEWENENWSKMRGLGIKRSNSLKIEIARRLILDKKWKELVFFVILH